DLTCITFVLGQIALCSYGLRFVFLRYHYVDQNMTWAEAQQHCRNEYTDLATVSSMADMERLRNINSEKIEIWIGLFNQTGTNNLFFPKITKQERMWFPQRSNFLSFLFFVFYSTGSSSLKYYLGDKMTWFDAQRYCRKNHTDLISGPQLEELQKTSVVNLTSLSSYNLIFIGLFRDAWTWSDGSSFSFRHWNVLYDNHVILINKNRTWEEALYYCRHYYNDLVTITNLDEQRWVQEKTKNATTPYVWTGLRYTCTLGFWFWVSDEVVRYKNWASPEQVNKCDMSGAMETGGEHKWFKINAEDKFNFICSK
uniref:C-type mannose receptor 2-like n=1 Tax=Oryzias melastigma TaxID=30732 RepID=A0A3B3DZS7_ORYME